MEELKIKCYDLLKRINEVEKFYNNALVKKASSNSLLSVINILEKSDYNDKTVYWLDLHEDRDHYDFDFDGRLSLVGKTEIDMFKQFLEKLMEHKVNEMQKVVNKIEVTQND